MNKKFPIAKEGYPFIFGALIIVLILFFTKTNIILQSPFILLLLFIIYFFRDPNREILAAENDKVLVSPADGKIIKIERDVQTPYIPEKMIQVSIFLSVFNVHVNRFPTSGKVVDIKYFPGKFLAAWNDKASLLNEQTHFVIKHEKSTIIVKQIAGLIARRIVWWYKINDNFNKGDRFGLIRFGSRVDMFLPSNTSLEIKIGDKVAGGITKIGTLA